LSPRRPDTDDILAVAALRYANGTPRYSQRYIGALFDIDRSHVAHILRRTGAPRRRRYAAKISVLPR
jgi:hypothetical protein